MNLLKIARLSKGRSFVLPVMITVLLQAFLQKGDSGSKIWALRKFPKPKFLALLFLLLFLDIEAAPKKVPNQIQKTNLFKSRKFICKIQVFLKSSKRENLDLYPKVTGIKFVRNKKNPGKTS